MNGVPRPTIERLVIYYRFLKRIAESSESEIISSLILGTGVGVSAAQVRKDLSYFGEFGCKGVGYQISDLKNSLEKILGFNQTRSFLLIGAGNIGRALVHYSGFKVMGLNIIAVCDCDLDKIGNRLGGLYVQSSKQISEIIAERQIKMAIIAVPGNEAQGVADKLVEAGIEAIWNFAPVILKLPDDILVYYEDLASSLITLTFCYQQKNQQTNSSQQKSEPG